jgi:hypothetical protein
MPCRLIFRTFCLSLLAPKIYKRPEHIFVIRPYSCWRSPSWLARTAPWPCDFQWRGNTSQAERLQNRQQNGLFQKNRINTAVTREMSGLNLNHVTVYPDLFSLFLFPGHYSHHTRCQLSSLILQPAAVGAAWSLLGSPRNGQAALYLFSKTFTLLGERSKLQSVRTFVKWIQNNGACTKLLLLPPCRFAHSPIPYIY